MPVSNTYIDPNTGLPVSKEENEAGWVLAKESNNKKVNLATVAGEGTQFFGYEVGLSDIESYLDEGVEIPGNLYGDSKAAIELMDYQRYRNQGSFTRALNSTLSGILGGVMTAGEDLVGIGEIVMQKMDMLEETERSVLGQFFHDSKEEIYKTFPIYKAKPDDFSIAELWRGILDSAVGFGLAGGYISKGVGITAKLLRAEKALQVLVNTTTKPLVRAKLLKQIEGINMVLSSPAAQNIIESIPAGFIQNMGEGRVMGLETAEQVREKLEPLVAMGVITREDLEKEVTEAYTKVYNGNKAFLLSDIVSLWGINKLSGGATRTHLPSDYKYMGMFKRVLGTEKYKFNLGVENPLFQGIKEYGEETGQGVLQREAEYQVLSPLLNETLENYSFDNPLEEALFKEQYRDILSQPEDAIDRYISFFTDPQVQIEGLMGLFGGGPQRVVSKLISGQYSKSYRNRMKELENERRDLDAATRQYFSNLEKDVRQKLKEISEIKDPEMRKKMAQHIIQMKAANLISRNMKNGNMEGFLNQLDSYIEEYDSLSDDIKEAFGSKESLLEFKRTINLLERQYGEIFTLPTASKVIELNTQIKALTDLIEQSKKSDKTGEIQSNKEKIKTLKQEINEIEKKLKDRQADSYMKYKYKTKKQKKEEEHKKLRKRLAQLRLELNKEEGDKLKSIREKAEEKRKKLKNLLKWYLSPIGIKQYLEEEEKKKERQKKTADKSAQSKRKRKTDGGSTSSKDTSNPTTDSKGTTSNKNTSTNPGTNDPNTSSQRKDDGMPPVDFIPELDDDTSPKGDTGDTGNKNDKSGKSDNGDTSPNLKEGDLLEHPTTGMIYEIQSISGEEAEVSDLLGNDDKKSLKELSTYILRTNSITEEELEKIRKKFEKSHKKGETIITGENDDEKSISSKTGSNRKIESYNKNTRGAEFVWRSATGETKTPDNEQLATTFFLEEMTESLDDFSLEITVEDENGNAIVVTDDNFDELMEKGRLVGRFVHKKTGKKVVISINGREVNPIVYVPLVKNGNKVTSSFRSGILNNLLSNGTSSIVYKNIEKGGGRAIFNINTRNDAPEKLEKRLDIESFNLDKTQGHPVINIKTLSGRKMKGNVRRHSYSKKQKRFIGTLFGMMAKVDLRKAKLGDFYKIMESDSDFRVFKELVDLLAKVSNTSPENLPLDRVVDLFVFKGKDKGIYLNKRAKRLELRYGGKEKFISYNSPSELVDIFSDFDMLLPNITTNSPNTSKIKKEMLFTYMRNNLITLPYELNDNNDIFFFPNVILKNDSYEVIKKRQVNKNADIKKKKRIKKKPATSIPNDSEFDKFLQSQIDSESKQKLEGLLGDNNNIKAAIKAEMKLTGITDIKEATNNLLNKLC